MNKKLRKVRLFLVGIISIFFVSNCNLLTSPLKPAISSNPDSEAVNHLALAPDSKGSRLAPDSKGSRLVPDSKGSRLAPDSKGSRLVPDSKGSRLVPDSKGSRLVPDSKGSRLVPDSKGSRLVPDSKGSRLVPDSKGSRLVPDSKGSRLVPDSKGPKRITLPPLDITIPPLGFTFPPRGITIPPLGFTFPPRGFSAISGRLVLPSNILTPSLINSSNILAPSLATSSNFKVQNTSSIDLQRLFEDLTIYANDKPLKIAPIFQDIQMDTNQQIMARYYIERLPIEKDMVLTLKSKRNPAITYLSSWVEHSENQVYIQDMNTHTTALSMIHRFSHQFSSLDIAEQVSLIPLELEIIHFLASEKEPNVFKSTQFDSIVKSLAISITPGLSQPQSFSELPSQVEVPVESTVPLRASVHLTNGSRLSDIRWSIENPQIALIDSNGIIHPIRSGQTTLIASIPGFPALNQRVRVNITTLKEISLSPSVVNLSSKGDTYQLNYVVKSDQQTLFTVSPEQIKWTSDNPDLIEVDQSGHIKALASTGFSEITAQLHQFPDINGKAEVRIVTHGFSSGEKALPTPAPVAGLNQPPTITSVIADTNPVTGVGYTTKIVSNANDIDNTLTDDSFTWSCDGGCGTFNRTDSNTVYWTAPLTPGGPYTIRVSVSDGINPAVQSTVNISVLNGNTNINGTGGYY